MDLYQNYITAIKQFGEHTALQWDGGNFSFQDLLEHANRAGHFLEQAYPVPGENIVLICPNTPFFIPVIIGILGAGHTIVPLNPLLNPSEMALLIQHSDAPVVLYDPVLEEKMPHIQRQLKENISWIPLPKIFEECRDCSDLSPSTSGDALSMILYTSGTTGNPKGVMLTHRNILTNYNSFANVLHFGMDDTFICILPLFHTFAMTVLAFAALIKGGKVILFPQFAPQKVMEVMVNETNVILIAVPPMLQLLARLAPPEVANNHNLRIVVSGGGPLPRETGTAFWKKFNHEVLEGYGLTEAAPVVSLNPPEKNVAGTIGTTIEGVDVQIRDKDGKALPPGETGELCVMGDNIMKGYYKNPDATDAAFHKDGWLRTGDMAVMDKNGYITIKGRYKDLIVSAGENIYPREIEETLMKVTGVLDAAVVGKPDKLRSEVPFAFVTIADEAKGKIDDKMLRQFCKEHLAEYKIPDGFEIIEQMPKTPTGKIQKNKLKEMHFNKDIG